MGKSRSSALSTENGPVSAREPESVSWTFLTNHAHVLIVLRFSPTIVLREVAAQVGITERAVQRIVRDLEEGGYLSREKVGRQNLYEVNEALPLRHPIEAHRTIGDLLQLIREQAARPQGRNATSG